MSSLADQIIADGNVEKVEAMQAEIERLRAALEEQNGAMAIMQKARNATIEKCANVAECTKGHPDAPMYLLNKTIAAAIRALKDKP